MSAEEKNKIIKQINLQKEQHIFFTTIDYGQLYHIVSRQPAYITQQHDVLLVCGIANPRPLKHYLAENAASYIELSYSDLTFLLLMI